LANVLPGARQIVEKKIAVLTVVAVPVVPATRQDNVKLMEFVARQIVLVVSDVYHLIRHHPAAVLAAIIIPRFAVVPNVSRIPGNHAEILVVRRIKNVARGVAVSPMRNNVVILINKLYEK